MGRKLNRNEFMKSSVALHDYFMDNGADNAPYKAKVVVLDKRSNNLVLRIEPTITVAYDTMTMRINIFWEDAGYSGEEFRNMGLYGYYDCVWVPMEYSDNILEINSPDSDKLVRVYL